MKYATPDILTLVHKHAVNASSVEATVDVAAGEEVTGGFVTVLSISVTMRHSSHEHDALVVDLKSAAAQPEP